MPPTRRNGFVDARGRAALNAHQTTAILVWTCEALGFYLLLAPSIANARLRRGATLVKVPGAIDALSAAMSVAEEAP